MGRREAPVPDGPLRDFARGLRELRAHAPGSPTYRTLAARARYSPSALSDAASGRRLPSWEVTAAFVEACGGDVAQWRQLWQDLDVRLRHNDPTLLPEPEPEGDRRSPAPGSPGPGTEDSHDLGHIAGEGGGEPARTSPDAAPVPHEAVVATLSPSDPAKVGPFRLLGRLGSGAMGVVYLGVSRAGRPVAVKVVRGHLAENPLFRERFAAEVAAVRKVQGPFTPAVVDADTDAQQPWLATVYLPGPSLREAVRTGGPLPAAVVLGLAAGIAEALAAFHDVGVLHRDLTPGNVLLDTDGPKVIDFGVARALDASRLTRTGMLVGTVPFMAPEQAAGQEITGAADIFALGCVLAYAATGSAPFGEGSDGQVLYRIAHADPDPAALECGDDRLRDLITRCLDKNPARRPTPQDIIAACGGDRPQEVAWLPTAAATRLAARREEISETLAKAATRRTVVRVKLTAVPLMLATAVALVVLLTTGNSGMTLAPPPDSGGAPPTSAATAAGPSASLSPTSSPHQDRPASAPKASASHSSGDNGQGSPTPSATRRVGGGAAPVRWTGYSGTRCASSGAAPTSFYPESGAWKTTTGGAYIHGCNAAQYSRLAYKKDDPNYWGNNADWVFKPGTKISSCSFRIHVAKGTWASSATYKVYNVDSTNVGNVQFFDGFTFDQHAYDAGGWYTSRRFTFHTGTIDLALTNAGNSGSYGVVADIVEASCS
ncbi:protein kinase [Streptomyces sp. NPDC006668]|uniref:protein kinase domain-containing protein n=1 Tax=Streptomyces sp. NPDC006668 TaxID=3156903 RepID=UPI00340A466D